MPFKTEDDRNDHDQAQADETEDDGKNDGTYGITNSTVPE